MSEAEWVRKLQNDYAQLQQENERLRAKLEAAERDVPYMNLVRENIQQADRIQELEDALLNRGLSHAPCDVCGYNGPLYYANGGPHKCVEQMLSGKRRTFANIEAERIRVLEAKLEDAQGAVKIYCDDYNRAAERIRVLEELLRISNQYSYHECNEVDCNRCSQQHRIDAALEEK